MRTHPTNFKQAIVVENVKRTEFMQDECYTVELWIASMICSANVLVITHIILINRE